jgi:hypothetical protein
MSRSGLSPLSKSLLRLQSEYKAAADQNNVVSYFAFTYNKILLGENNHESYHYQ